jgi:hypothetical protein
VQGLGILGVPPQGLPMLHGLHHQVRPPAHAQSRQSRHGHAFLSI